MTTPSPHTFHIPVMGLAYTIDSPIKVAQFGISSVISIVEDRLVEMMRSHYYPMINKEYQPISTQEPDYRTKRITDYLKKYGTEKGLQVVLKYDAGSDLLFAGQSMDISQDVIAGLNAEYAQEGTGAKADSTATKK